MANDHPLVSVVTATYNMAHFLPEVIESVLNQTYQNIQYIIIDDGSTDDSRAVVNRYADDPRIEYHYQDNQGQTRAKNEGISRSDGEFICFLDGDNSWELDKLGNQIRAFSELGPEYKIVYTDQDCIDDNGDHLYTPKVKRFSGQISTELLFNNFVTFNTAMVRRECFLEAGSMNEDLARSIDYELWLRFSVKYLFHYLPGVTTHYRLWDGQMSQDKERRFRYAFKIVDSFLAAHPELVDPLVAKRSRAYNLTSRARYRMGAGNFSGSLEDIVASLKMDPISIYSWKSLFRLFVKRK